MSLFYISLLYLLRQNYDLMAIYLAGMFVAKMFMEKKLMGKKSRTHLSNLITNQLENTHPSWSHVDLCYKRLIHYSIKSSN